MNAALKDARTAGPVRPWPGGSGGAPAAVRPDGVATLVPRAPASRYPATAGAPGGVYIGNANGTGGVVAGGRDLGRDGPPRPGTSRPAPATQTKGEAPAPDRAGQGLAIVLEA